VLRVSPGTLSSPRSEETPKVNEESRRFRRGQRCRDGVSSESPNIARSRPRITRRRPRAAAPRARSRDDLPDEVGVTSMSSVVPAPPCAGPPTRQQARRRLAAATAHAAASTCQCHCVAGSGVRRATHWQQCQATAVRHTGPKKAGTRARQAHVADVDASCIAGHVSAGGGQLHSAP
jgi:hypothetical protein